MVLDFLVDWSITQLILAAAVLMVVVLVASYLMAIAWRRWKEGRRAKARQARGLPPPEPARTGARFTPRAIITKLPKPAAPKFARPKLALPKLGKKKAS